jgi:hypothetical protein
MEPEVRAFLIRIVQSLSMTLLWMSVNMAIGIRFDLAFPHNGISTGNIIFYIFFVTSFAGLIWYLLRIWKEALLGKRDENASTLLNEDQNVQVSDTTEAK